MVDIATIRPPTLAGSRGAVLGMSYEANAVNGGNWTSYGWVNWLRRFSMGAIDLPQSRVFATPGKTSSEIIALWLTAAVAAKPNWCVVDVTVNDALGGTGGIVVSTAQGIANLQTIYNALNAAGTHVIFRADRPWNAGSMGGPWAGNVLLQHVNTNQWMKTFCESNTGCTYWDPNPVMIDFATGYGLASLLNADGAHDNAAGAMTTGLSGWNLISSLIPARDNRFSLLGDVYDAVNNPHGNLLANGLLGGAYNTGGTYILNANATTVGGQIAPSWNFYGGGAGSTVNLVGSKLAYAGYTNLYKQRFTVTGTADGTKNSLYQPVTSNVANGDMLVAQAEVSLNLASGSIIAVQAEIGGCTGNIDGIQGGTTDVYLTGANSFLLRTDPALVTVAANCQFNLNIIATTSGAITSSTVDFARCSLRKV